MFDICLNPPVITSASSSLGILIHSWAEMPSNSWLTQFMNLCAVDFSMPKRSTQTSFNVPWARWYKKIATCSFTGMGFLPDLMNQGCKYFLNLKQIYRKVSLFRGVGNFGTSPASDNHFKHFEWSSEFILKSWNSLQDLKNFKEFPSNFIPKISKKLKNYKF